MTRCLIYLGFVEVATDSCSRHQVVTSTIPYHNIPQHTIPYHTIPYHTNWSTHHTMGVNKDKDVKSPELLPSN